MKIQERLSSLEAKVGMLLDLLKEVKEDFKEYPTREEFEALEEDIKELHLSDLDHKKEFDALRDSVIKVIIKTGIISGILGLLFGMSIHWWIK
jgi:hypothetical protein